MLNTFSTISRTCIFRLFKLGRQIMNDGLYMHVIVFRDNIQDSRLVAILLLKSVPNHFPDMHGPILLKLDKCHKCHKIMFLYVTWLLKSVAHTHTSSKYGRALSFHSAKLLKPRGLWHFMSFYLLRLPTRWKTYYFRVDCYYYFSYSCFSPLSFCQL